MGACDRQSGTCLCHMGFDGKACERLACPEACALHGQCRSLRRAAQLKNGHSLVRAGLVYDRWDADRPVSVFTEPLSHI